MSSRVSLWMPFLLACLIACPSRLQAQSGPTSTADTSGPIASANASGAIRQLEVSVLDRQGLPIRGLGPEDFLVLEDGEAELIKPLRAVSAQDEPHDRHLVFLIDLPTSALADRHLAMPALRSFLIQRARQGDRITVAALGRGAPAEQIDLLSRFAQRPHEIESAFDRLSAIREASFQARRHRRTDIRRELRDAYQTLERALSLIEGDGRSTLVLYLGRSLAAGIGESSFSEIRTFRSPPPESEASDYVGSIQYLVSMPRSGPLESKARGEGDRLLAAALRAEARVFPLIAGNPGPGAGSELWLATETGGRPLPLRRLESELAKLEQELDSSYQLSFKTTRPDDRFHRVEVRAAGSSAPKSQVRHLRGYQAKDVPQRLAAQARAAWQLGLLEDDLGLQARLASDREGNIEALELQLTAPDTTGTLSLSLAVPTQKDLVTRFQSLPYKAPDGDDKTLRLRIPLRLPKGFQGLGLALRDSNNRQSVLPLYP